MLIQPYLNNNLPKSIVKHLTKVRISTHTLLIEKGRYHRPKISRNLRLCSSCNRIEEEEHFIMYYININGQNISSELTTMNRKS
jgi:hypothetical protein